jgi:hypothetical protein
MAQVSQHLKTGIFFNTQHVVSVVQLGEAHHDTDYVTGMNKSFREQSLLHEGNFYPRLL